MRVEGERSSNVETTNGGLGESQGGTIASGNNGFLQKKAVQGAKIEQMMQQLNEQRSALTSSGPFMISATKEGEGELRISLNSTAIKEGADKRPYIEYLLYCSTNYEKWMITRKYKDFSDLHHAIAASIPGFRFPESANILFNPTYSDQQLNIKKPGFLEERRKLLQLYLRDLAKIDLVRRSRPFRNFLSNEGLSNELLEHDDAPDSILKTNPTII